jgi:hypothetical protein
MPPTSYQDVMMSALTGGAEAVAGLEPLPSKGVLLRACFALQHRERRDIADDVFALIQAAYPKGTRGRKPPCAGVIRPYSIQLSSSGVRYARIPIIWDQEPGTKVRVRFHNHKIEILNDEYPE